MSWTPPMSSSVCPLSMTAEGAEVNKQSSSKSIALQQCKIFSHERVAEGKSSAWKPCVVNGLPRGSSLMTTTDLVGISALKPLLVQPPAMTSILTTDKPTATSTTAQEWYLLRVVASLKNKTCQLSVVSWQVVKTLTTWLKWLSIPHSCSSRGAKCYHQSLLSADRQQIHFECLYPRHKMLWNMLEGAGVFKPVSKTLLSSNLARQWWTNFPGRTGPSTLTRSFREMTSVVFTAFKS